MLHLSKKLEAASNAAKKYAGKSSRFLSKHRVPATLVACLLMLSMLMSVITVTIHRVDVVEDGTLLRTFYAVRTDEEALLSKADLTLNEGDELEIAQDGGTVTVSVSRAFPVSIEADGEVALVLMTGGTVAEALEKAGVTVNENDVISHLPTAEVAEGIEIKIYRVTGEEIVETESIAYETEKIETNDLYVGQTEVKQKGEKGVRTRTYSVTYVNGEETERTLVSDEVTKEPVKKIVLVGTKVKSTFLKTSSTPTNYKKVIAMTATAYSAGGTTATGIPAKWGVVAVDPNVIPLGTKVYIETADGKYIYGTAVAADIGGAIKGNKIDICVNTRAEAYSFGRRTVNVYIL